MAGDLTTLYDQGKTPPQKLFVQAYDGDAEATAKRLDLKLSIVRRWEASEWFKDALTKREEREVAALRRDNIYQLTQAVTGRLQLQAFWSDTASNTEARMADRLKASEMLAKSHGMLVEKVEHSGNAQKPIMVAQSDLQDRLKLVLGKPKDAICVPSVPLQEITDDDGSWLDEPAAECPQPEPRTVDGVVCGSAGVGEHGDDQGTVQDGSILPPGDWLS